VTIQVFHPYVKKMKKKYYQKEDASGLGALAVNGFPCPSL
jgi:hypothetical protein